ncbi:hypothetical protein C8Q74DRAFT_189722 [Fomes fomentarius]|nr:hypothetical protein C8Q74DRAFT_189722 [Fomes fomentarius]
MISSIMTYAPFQPLRHPWGVLNPAPHLHHVIRVSRSLLTSISLPHTSRGHTGRTSSVSARTSTSCSRRRTASTASAPRGTATLQRLSRGGCVEVRIPATGRRGFRSRTLNVNAFGLRVRAGSAATPLLRSAWTLWRFVTRIAGGCAFRSPETMRLRVYIYYRRTTEPLLFLSVPSCRCPVGRLPRLVTSGCRFMCFGHRIP